MIVGKSYAEVKAETGDCYLDGGSQFPADQYLTEHGFAIGRIYRYDQFRKVDGRNQVREVWPIPPFAPVHLCMVHVVQSMGHLVVMLSDGTVLDPLNSSPRQLSNYLSVEYIAGIWKVR